MLKITRKLSRNPQGHTKEGKKVAETQNGSTENKDISSEDPKAKKASPEKYASIYPGPNATVDNKVSDLIKRLESVLGFPIWLMIQNGGGKVLYDEINSQVFAGFRNNQKEILDHSCPR